MNKPRKQGPRTKVGQSERKRLIKLAAEKFGEEENGRLIIEKQTPSNFDRLVEKLEEIFQETKNAYFKETYSKDVNLEEVKFSNKTIASVYHEEKKFLGINKLLLDALYFFNFDEPRESFIKNKPGHELAHIIKEAEDELASQHADYEEEFAQLQQRKSELAEENSALNQQIESAREEINRLYDENRRLNEEKNSINHRTSSLDQTIASLEKKLADAEEAYEQTRKEKEDLTAKLADLGNNCTKLAQDCQSLEQTNAAHEQRILELTGTAEKERQEILRNTETKQKKLQQKIDSLAETEEYLRQQKAILEEKNESLNKALAAFDEEKKKLEAERADEKRHFEQTIANLQETHGAGLARIKKTYKKEKKVLSFCLAVILLSLIGTCVYFFTLANDYHILPYSPTEAQKNSLAGVWEVYSPSPQARSSQPAEQTYHKVVLNVMQIAKKPGFDYLVFDRHGPGFDQRGRIEFKSANVVDIYAETVNDSGIVISPKHTTLLLEENQPFLTALSLTWNFDKQNKPIASREVYVKKGNEGLLSVSKNPVTDFMSRERNAFWKHDNRVDTFRLRNVFLDSLPVQLQQSLDENSILLRVPGEIKIISRHDSVGKVLSETFQKQQGKLP